MFQDTIALIGLGAIGTPIAHKLYKTYGNQFALVASGTRRKRLEESQMLVNGEKFVPSVISKAEEAVNKVALLLVCIKNYDLEESLKDIKKIVTEETIILPLQNGIHSYEFFCQQFSNNQILQGYVQGPNTRRCNNKINYSNAGVMHIGKSDRSTHQCVQNIYDLLKNAKVDVNLEDDIKKMVWKKWMLNVAGNSVTALTGADYSQFKKYRELQSLCRSAMQEFLKVALAENIALAQNDIEDVLYYYVTYKGSKNTSMLEDVLNKRRTENRYLAGELLDIAKRHDLDLPIIRTLYSLIKVKEYLYTEE